MSGPIGVAGIGGGGDYTLIKDLKAGMKNINAVFIVLEVGAATLTKEAREVRSVRVADSSASVALSVWDGAGALLQPGDIVRLARGYCQPWRGALTLYAGKSGDLQKVGEFCMLFNDQVNMSEPQPALMGASNGTRGPPTASVPPGPPVPPGAPVPPGPPTTDNKPPHKTYVRGRGHPRGGRR